MTRRAIVARPCFSYAEAFKSQEFSFLQVSCQLTENICLLLTVNQALLPKHFDFNRFLKRNFLTCYFCLYYSSMHAPIKKKTVRGYSIPFMNKEFIKALYTRNRLRNEFFKYPAKENE